MGFSGMILDGVKKSSMRANWSSRGSPEHRVTTGQNDCPRDFLGIPEDSKKWNTLENSGRRQPSALRKGVTGFPAMPRHSNPWESLRIPH